MFMRERHRERERERERETDRQTDRERESVESQNKEIYALLCLIVAVVLNKSTKEI